MPIYKPTKNNTYPSSVILILKFPCLRLNMSQSSTSLNECKLDAANEELRWLLIVLIDKNRDKCWREVALNMRQEFLEIKFTSKKCRTRWKNCINPASFTLMMLKKLYLLYITPIIKTNASKSLRTSTPTQHLLWLYTQTHLAYSE